MIKSMRSDNVDTILITGAAGFIGSCLVRRLLKEDQWRLVSFDKLTYAGHLASLGAAQEHPRHTFVQGDVCNQAQLREVFQRFSPAAVFHLAAETHVDRSIDGPAAFVDTNVGGTLRLLEAAREHWIALPAKTQAQFRLLHVSTDEVYGSADGTESFTESSPFRPNSPYAASKAAADHLLRAYFHTYGLPVLTTHCSNNYGPYQFPEKLIPLMILNALAGKPLPVYGDGGNIRDWLFVEDHCAALHLVLKRGVPGESYNISGNCLRSNLEIVKAICRFVDQTVLVQTLRPTSDLITFVPDRPGHDRRYSVDSGKIRALGWRPQQTLESGLSQTVAWYLDNASWIESVSSGRYRQERLGLGAAACAEPQLA